MRPCDHSAWSARWSQNDDRWEPRWIFPSWQFAWILRAECCGVGIVPMSADDIRLGRRNHVLDIWNDWDRRHCRRGWRFLTQMGD